MWPVYECTHVPERYVEQWCLMGRCPSYRVPAKDQCWPTYAGLCLLGITLFLSLWLTTIAWGRFKRWQRCRAARALLLRLSEEDTLLLLEQWPASRLEHLFTPAKVLSALHWCEIRVKLDQVHKQQGRPLASIEYVDQLHHWMPRADMEIEEAELKMTNEMDRRQRVGFSDTPVYEEKDGYPLWQFDTNRAIY